MNLYLIVVYILFVIFLYFRKGDKMTKAVIFIFSFIFFIHFIYDFYSVYKIKNDKTIKIDSLSIENINYISIKDEHYPDNEKDSLLIYDKDTISKLLKIIKVKEPGIIGHNSKDCNLLVIVNHNVNQLLYFTICNNVDKGYTISILSDLEKRERLETLKYNREDDLLESICTKFFIRHR